MIAKAPHDFMGGLRLPGHKLYGEQARSQTAPIPPQLMIPLQQHQGPAATPCVEIGTHVLRGDCLARASNPGSVAVHASSSGWVRAVEMHPVANGGEAPCVVLETDQEDLSRDQVLGACYHSPQGLSAKVIIERIAQAGIVGLGGASFPSASKLQAAPKAIEHLILNGAECEPYISCDGASMLEDAASIVRGSQWLSAACGAERISIAVEDNHPAALESLQAAITQAQDPRIELVQVPSRYPQGGERQLIQSLMGLEVPQGGLPQDLGLAVFNVATAVAVYQALEYAQPLTERIVTVTGSAIAQPRNWRVRLGTPLHTLVAASGGLSTEQPIHMLMGGAMMGLALGSTQIPISKGFNCLLVGPPSDLEPSNGEHACIRCGDCVPACPAGLLPQQLYWHTQARNFSAASELHLDACIECGACAVVCPSELPLVQYYRYAKAELAHAAEERRKAEHAKSRYIARNQRLEQEQREREAQRQRRQEALQAAQQAAGQPSDPSSTVPPAVQAALAKARAQASQSKSGPGVSPAVKAAQERARQQRAQKSGSQS